MAPAAVSDAVLLTAAGDGLAPAVLLTVAAGKRQYLFQVPEGAACEQYFKHLLFA